MISVEEAKNLIVKSTKQLNPIRLDSSKSLNYVLAEDIISPIYYPPFSQSAMDGFAILYSDIQERKEIEIMGEAPAGIPFKEEMTSGQTIRIFTGGMIPDGADTVIIQERVSIENGKIVSTDNLLSKGANIRKKGSQIEKGDIILKKGMTLNAGAIGYLTGMGISSIEVFPKPKVSIIVTGNELQKPGMLLKDGQIYESNSFALNAALQSIDITPKSILAIEDDEEITKRTLATAIENSDVVLVSGGISVGKYDFVGKCLQELKVENIFYKIAQKPGKPIFFGKKEDCLIFGLPGNPTATLNCFYEYVFPTLRTMQGFSDVFLKAINLPISSDFSKKRLSLFLRGKISDGKVNLLMAQESNSISSFAFADCIIYLPAEKSEVKTRETVEVHLLPQ